jgi:hypothetical protein
MRARSHQGTGRGDRLHALHVLALHPGLRRGESLGLQRLMLTSMPKAFTIRRTLQRVSGELRAVKMLAAEAKNPGPAFPLVRGSESPGEEFRGQGAGSNRRPSAFHAKDNAPTRGGTGPRPRAAIRHGALSCGAVATRVATWRGVRRWRRCRRPRSRSLGGGVHRGRPRNAQGRLGRRPCPARSGTRAPW